MSVCVSLQWIHAQAQFPCLMCMVCIKLQACGGAGQTSLGDLKADSKIQENRIINLLRKERATVEGGEGHS